MSDGHCPNVRCQNHFDRHQFDRRGNRIRNGYPCLFSAKEISHGIPLRSTVGDHFSNHNYFMPIARESDVNVATTTGVEDAPKILERKCTKKPMKKLHVKKFGSYQCRVGWASRAEPQLVFKSLMAKPRKERGKKDAEPPVTPPVQIGNDILNIEAVRFQLKSQFDKNIVTHFEVQEHLLDYVFQHLGVEGDGRVPHPILMTEALLTPNYCRQLMSELLFEGYGVPGVCYAVDSLLSLRRNRVGDSALIVNCGHHTIHILPVLRGVAIIEHARRINLGGGEMTSYLHKLLQLKYPVHVNAINMSRAEELLTQQCRIALDYQEEIRRWSNPQYYEENVKRVQLPFTQPAAPTVLSAEAQKERKKEMAKRLIEINARKREERLAEDEDQLNQLLSIQDMLDEGENDEFNQALKAFDIKNYDELQRQIVSLNARIEKSRQRIAAATCEEPAASDARAGRQQPPHDPELLTAWLDELRSKHAALVTRREARRARRADMARRRTAAGAERMRVISRLAAAGDDFGQQDSDWDVYKSISREADSDSEADAEQLMELEEVLREHEPTADVPSLQHRHQLHLAIEHLRAPELIFQPSMMGNIEAGLAETMEYVFKHFTPEDQLLLANNVFVTGGASQFPGLKERLERELLEMRPFQSTHRVIISDNASLDAWYGARDLAQSSDFLDICITRQEYYELGGEYLREHRASNRYFPSPAPIDNTPAGDANVIKEEIVVD